MNVKSATPEVLDECAGGASKRTFGTTLGAGLRKMTIPFVDLICKKTVFSTGLGTIVAFVGALWFVSGEIQATMGQVSFNTASIYRLEVANITHQINSKKEERRTLNRELRKDGSNTLLIDQLAEVEDEHTELEAVRSCLRNPANQLAGRQSVCRS